MFYRIEYKTWMAQNPDWGDKYKVLSVEKNSQSMVVVETMLQLQPASDGCLWSTRQL